jgi:hypothetical protein
VRASDAAGLHALGILRAVRGVGASGAAAQQALALGDDGGTTSTNGNNSLQQYGNSATYGNMSPQMALIQGSLNKPCVGLPAKVNAGSLVGVVPVAVQDVPVLSSPQNQQCTENSTQAKGDEPLSHVLDDIPVLSGYGTGNSRVRRTRSGPPSGSAVRSSSVRGGSSGLLLKAPQSPYKASISRAYADVTAWRLIFKEGVSRPFSSENSPSTRANLRIDSARETAWFV